MLFWTDRLVLEVVLLLQLLSGPLQDYLVFHGEEVFNVHYNVHIILKVTERTRHAQ